MQTKADPDAIGEDAKLLAAFAAGDPAAARVLAERHLPRVYRVALRMLGSVPEAEDVAQDAMLRLWKIAPEWQPGRAQLGSWLYRVTSNLATDRLRRRARDGFNDDAALDNLIDPTPGIEATMIQTEQDRALHAAMDRLPPRQKLALVLRHFEQFSQPEIAATMDTTTEAVEGLLGRARRTLAALLQPKGRTAPPLEMRVK